MTTNSKSEMHYKLLPHTTRKNCERMLLNRMKCEKKAARLVKNVPVDVNRYENIAMCEMHFQILKAQAESENRAFISDDAPELEPAGSRPRVTIPKGQSPESFAKPDFPEAS